jgi:hypothetical protein
MSRPASLPGVIGAFTSDVRAGIDPSSRHGSVGQVTKAAGGTVRWGLRSGHDAWPFRSAPASAVGEFVVNG